MPDLVTHIASGIALGALARRPWYTPALVVGSCLPDLLGRVPAYGMSSIEAFGVVVPKEWMFGTAFLHLPMGILLATSAVALLGARRQRVALWGLLTLGAFLHLALDALQIHWGEAYMWFFPFSQWEWEAGVMGSEATVFTAPVWLFLSYGFWRWRHTGQPWSGTRGRPESLGSSRLD